MPKRRGSRTGNEYSRKLKRESPNVSSGSNLNRRKVWIPPVELLEMIFKNVEPIDIFHYSLISPTCRQLTSQISTKTQNLSFYHNIHERSICVKVDETKESKFIIISSSKKFKEFSNHQEIEGITVGVEKSIEGFMTFFCKSEKDSGALFKTISKFVLLHFKTNNIWLRSVTDNKQDFFFITRFAYQLETVNVEWYEKITKRELECLMDHLEIEWFYLKVFPGRKFKYTGTLTAKKLKIWNATWISGESLLNMKCQKLILHDTVFEALDLRNLIRHWRNGHLDQLEFCHFHQQDDFEMQLDDLTKWHAPLTLFKCDNDLISVDKTWYLWNCNGELATVEVKPKEFKFFIWKERFLLGGGVQNWFY